MARDKRRLPPDDDGHTIVSMDVDGMPGRRPANLKQGEDSARPQSPLTRSETRWWMLGALNAGLLIAAIFSVVIILFVVLLLVLWR